MLITQLMNFMSKSVPGSGEHRVLLMLDEFQNLGKLENVMEAATILGGYGVPTWFFVQSLKSVDTIYREEGRKTLVNSARVQVFFGAQDAEDLKYISDTLGERTEKQKDVSQTQATMFDMHHARTVHVKEVMRPLMRPDEIRTMSRNKCIILPRGSHAIFGTRNFYFADSELMKRAWLTIPAFNGTTDAVATKAEKPAQQLRLPDNDMITPSRYFTQQEPEKVNNTRARGAVFAARVGRKPRPAIVRSNAATPTVAPPSSPATSAPVVAPKRKSLNLAAITAAAASKPMDMEKQTRIAQLLAQTASLADRSSESKRFRGRSHEDCFGYARRNLGHKIINPEARAGWPLV